MWQSMQWKVHCPWNSPHQTRCGDSSNMEAGFKPALAFAQVRVGLLKLATRQGWTEEPPLQGAWGIHITMVSTELQMLCTGQPLRIWEASPPAYWAVTYYINITFTIHIPNRDHAISSLLPVCNGCCLAMVLSAFLSLAPLSLYLLFLVGREASTFIHQSQAPSPNTHKAQGSWFPLVPIWQLWVGEGRPGQLRWKSLGLD